MERYKTSIRGGVKRIREAYEAAQKRKPPKELLDILGTQLSEKERNEIILDNIAYRIGEFCKKWGRINVTQTKEKYMTVRVYCCFNVSLHSLVYPGYIYVRLPKWLDWLDWNLITPILQSIFGRSIFFYQAKIYRIAYKREVKKYPHLRNHILNSADYPVLLEDL